MRSSPHRVVLDTNIVISRMIFRSGLAAAAFDSLFYSSTLLTSTSILHELHKVARRKKFDLYIGLSERVAFVDTYAVAGTPVEVTETVQDCRDPKDNQILALALSGQADLILTGDQDLLVLHPWRGISILTPAQYLATIA